MVVVLRIAAEHACEKTLGSTLLQQVREHRLPDIKALQADYLNANHRQTTATKQHQVSDYDCLLPCHMKNAQQQQGSNTCH